MKVRVDTHSSFASLRTVPLEQRLAHLPAFLVDVLCQAQRSFQPRAVFLFGSRARGDATDVSDWDLAFDVPVDRNLEWTRFVVDLPESAETLLGMDAVDLNAVNARMREAIERDGIQLV